MTCKMSVISLFLAFSKYIFFSLSGGTSRINTQVVSNEAVALNINNLQPEDSGEYTCTVGPATDTYELLVEGRD